MQFGPPVEPATVKAAEGFTGIGMPENDIFYFHPDHLGSTSYISNRNGSISQHVEYIAFGEVLFEEHSSSFSSPYLFNVKELDRETNLTYMSNRYLDMKTSLWLTVDKLGEMYPNKGAYLFCSNDPINKTDPTGLCEDCPEGPKDGQKYESKKGGDWVALNGKWARDEGTLDEVVINTKDPLKELILIGIIEVLETMDLLMVKRFAI